VHWSYEGATGPEHWADLSPDFKMCKLGMEQSPIDLKDGIKAQTGEPFTLLYQPVGGKIVNTGHSIQVTTNPGCAIVIDGLRYELIQYHFHHPSEHLVEGRPYNLEAHFVHRAANGALTVIGTFFRTGNESVALTPIFQSMPNAAGAEVPFPGTLDPAAMFPVNRAYYRYMGSLTTPPCLEGLIWTMFREPLEASAAQIQKFAALYPMNARPVQNRNRRFLLERS
jgi:carbonic anhydrase